MLACGKYNLVYEFFRKVEKKSIPGALNYRGTRRRLHFCCLDLIADCSFFFHIFIHSLYCLELNTDQWSLLLWSQFLYKLYGEKVK